MVLEGSEVAMGDGLAVAEGGDAGGVAVIVGLDGDGGGLQYGVVDGDKHGLAEGVGYVMAAGMSGRGSGASAARGTQGKCRYEGSR